MEVEVAEVVVEVARVAALVHAHAPLHLPDALSGVLLLACPLVALVAAASARMVVRVEVAAALLQLVAAAAAELVAVLV